MDEPSSDENNMLIKLLRIYVLKTLPELALQEKQSTTRSPRSDSTKPDGSTGNASSNSDESRVDRPQHQMFAGCKCVSLTQLGLGRGKHKSKITWDTVLLHQKIIVSTTKQMQSPDHFQNVSYDLGDGHGCLYYKHRSRKPLNPSVVHKELDPTDILHVLVDGSEPRFLHCQICNKTFSMSNGWKMRMMEQHFLRDSHRRKLQQWTPIEQKTITLNPVTIPQLFSGAGTPGAKCKIRLIVLLAAHLAARPTLSFEVGISMLQFTRNLLSPFQKTILESTQASHHHSNIKQILAEESLPHPHLLSCTVLGIAEAVMIKKKQQNESCTVLWNSFDETRNIKLSEQLGFGVSRNVPGIGFKNEVLKAVDVTNRQSGAQIYNLIKKICRECGYDPERVAGNIADGASSVCAHTGPLRSCNARWISKLKLASETWCCAHQVNLPLQDALQLNGIQRIIKLIQKMHGVFKSHSCVQHKVLEDVIKQILEFMVVGESKRIGRLRRLSRYVTTRWSSFLRCVSTLVKLFDPATVALLILHRRDSNANFDELRAEMMQIKPFLLFLVDFKSAFDPCIKQLQATSYPICHRVKCIFDNLLNHFEPLTGIKEPTIDAIQLAMSVTPTVFAAAGPTRFDCTHRWTRCDRVSDVIRVSLHQEVDMCRLSAINMCVFWACDPLINAQDIVDRWCDTLTKAHHVWSHNRFCCSVNNAELIAVANADPHSVFDFVRRLDTDSESFGEFDFSKSDERDVEFLNNEFLSKLREAETSQTPSVMTITYGVGVLRRSMFCM